MSNPSSKRRILVIDDNDAIHSDFRKILATRGPSGLDDDEAAIFGDARPTKPQVEFETDFALQGKEGFDKVSAAVNDGRPYHVAFVDMRMPPGWDGVQTIKKLWDVDPDLQVVICTAYSDYSWEQILEQLGSTDRMLILKKPFDDAEVCQLATALTAKHLVTGQARLKQAELEELVVARTNELKEQALVDRLTGLPNRQLLNDRLTQLLLQNARDPKHHFALLFLDFDRFKVVNDSLGHEIGDLLLIEIAERLRQELRETDTVAVTAANVSTAVRLGGDEFIVVLDGVRDFHDAARVTERLLDALSKPYLLKGHVVHTTASVGITTSAVGYQNPEDMIRDADTAMYRAKAAGKARYVMFDRKMHEDAMARLTLETDLRLAISGNQFILHYQPIVCLSTGATTGFEALVRWKHPTRGMISPLEFIPLAEEIGVILPLGEWVLAEACRQLAAWRRHPAFAAMDMSVNLSRKQLIDPNLVPRIREILGATGIEPGSLKLEITESAMMEDAERGVQVLKEIDTLGVRLDLDDFGTGYSSLSCLHRFPIHGLKIDRSFVSNLGERRDYAAVVHAIVSLTHKLDIALVAEGIETLEQAKLLRSMGCDFAQGYYFSRPLIAEAAEKFVLEPKMAQSIATAA
jgi:diguanylate cyclase (GGDEF)-like protein